MKYLPIAFLMLAAMVAQGQPGPPAIKDVVISPVVCAGGSTGVISILPSGGEPPLQYSVNGGQSFQTSNVFTSLKAGSYTLLVKDKVNRFSQTKVVQVAELPKLTATCTGKNISCSGDSLGSVSVQVTGGTKPYRFKWSNGGQAASQTGLAAGTYTVTVMDSLQCTTICSANVIKLQPPAVKIISTNPTCTAASGTVRVDTSVLGGVFPYTYSWSNGSTAFTQSGLPAGTYTVTVTAANGCKGTASVTLVQQGSAIPKYQVGDSISCGYIVYFDTASNPKHPCATRYLVCAFKDQSTGVTWYNPKFRYTKTGATTDVLFDAANAGKLADLSLAANAASKFSTDSCTGWYLPSKAELNKMYTNLAAKGKGGFAREGYWTSVESTNPRKAWTVDFINGTQRVNDKATDNHVRAVCEIWIKNN